ncbi:FtsW/RodA/SpoVE family cell cycle protein [Blautia liquoris]|mgnify:FL=1|uniref:FtsW/RodA/SpoVE family cell cycle protein n=1 Tax=Blautia liquoris TaxID=2779518 RepID=A0A7M2RL29_9FIRM|nr:FtsW/RodA/SpoVE family cell cycle protein [Blautia liquoris]QOV20771.1 FtsW/RodA/SpoVE family cell cycle protein [Blautia liquoris]
MVNVIVELSKYILLLLMIWFTMESFLVLSKKKESTRKNIFRKQIIILLSFDLLAFFVMFLQTEDVKMILMYGSVLLYILFTQMLYRMIYKKASMNLVNNMCMLLSVGFIILSRLKIDNAFKQIQIVALSTAVSFLIPVIIRKAKFVRDLTWAYALIGLLLLAIVLVFAARSRGANLSITIKGINFQFSEFVKITFVFFLAGMLQMKTDIRQVAVTSVVAAMHVGILVLSKDLGTALVFFMAYLVIVYVSTEKPSYALAGLMALVLASVAAYFLFGHVRTRVEIWRDPFADYKVKGYQIVQALFGLTAGGWFGTGLFKGKPDTIPLASYDFTFAAISEEFGILFSICLILLCMSTFLLIVNISMKMSKNFYRLIAIGLGVEYAVQVFLTIGGTTKFIPMTGITLPLVSYGGSSVMSTIIMLSIIQGLYVLREDEEGEELEENRKKQIGKQKKSKSKKNKSNKGNNKNSKNNKNKPKGESGKKHGADDLEDKIAEQTKKSLHW